tara:strand:+ start:441 stop:719 length:279 start_codon:yes stop_codon:yes gene_type:complete
MKTFKFAFPEPKHKDIEVPENVKNITNWECPKCSNTSFEVGEFHSAGSKAAKIFDIQNTKFSTITCEKCSYTEIYKCPNDQLSNIFDFFIGR